MIWSAMLIPIIVGIVGYYFFNYKLTIIELLLGILGGILAIVISYFVIKSISLSDIEYNSYMIKEARYYEPWETYVHRTCTRSVSCGKNCHTTISYDCSYCDYNSEKYTVVDTGGNEYEISQETYYAYVRMWNYMPQQFVELNRHINYYGSCGKDGDMYRVIWDKTIQNSVSSTKEITFQNILKSNHSAFDYPEITKKQAKKLCLYEYPKIDNYYQRSILGIDSVKFNNNKYLLKNVNYLNGMLGEKYKVKVFLNQ